MGLAASTNRDTRSTRLTLPIGVREGILLGGRRKFALKITLYPNNKQFAQITRIIPKWIYAVLKTFSPFRIFEQLALALKNRVCPENFHCIEYIFVSIQDFWASCACNEIFQAGGLLPDPCLVRLWLYRCAAAIVVFTAHFPRSFTLTSEQCDRCHSADL